MLKVTVPGGPSCDLRRVDSASFRPVVFFSFDLPSAGPGAPKDPSVVQRLPVLGVSCISREFNCVLATGTLASGTETEVDN